MFSAHESLSHCEVMVKALKMEILKCIARRGFESPSHPDFTGNRDISVLSVDSTTLNPETRLFDTASLFNGIQNHSLFGKCSDVAPLHLIFFPEERWKKISKDKTQARLIFEYLRISESFLHYLMSSRAGWYWVDNGGGTHSFIIKEYLYMLAWSFNMVTFETRAMVWTIRDFSFPFQYQTTSDALIRSSLGNNFRTCIC
jgi:hypothetical protein